MEKLFEGFWVHLSLAFCALCSFLIWRKRKTITFSFSLFQKAGNAFLHSCLPVRYWQHQNVLLLLSLHCLLFTPYRLLGLSPSCLWKTSMSPHFSCTKQCVLLSASADSYLAKILIEARWKRGVLKNIHLLKCRLHSSTAEIALPWWKLTNGSLPARGMVQIPEGLTTTTR